MKYLTKHKKLIAITFYFTCVFSIAFVMASERINVCDYVSINGDFQNYNIFRRFLDGQTPFVDFASYTGIGTLLVNVPILIFNNTFANSLFVTNFTSFIIFTIVVATIFYLVTKNLYISLFISIFTPKFISSQILISILGQEQGTIFTQRFTDLFTPSNSIRSVRSFLPILLVIICYLGIFIYGKTKKDTVNLLQIINTNKFIMVTGFIHGFFIIWSNDFGFATVASIFIILLLLDFLFFKSPFKNIVINLLILISSAILGLLTSTTLITKGNPFAWFKSTIETAEYQGFYFYSGSPVIKYIFSNFTLLIYTFLFIFILCYYLYKLIKNQIEDNDIYLVFIILSILGATYIYIIGTGLHSMCEPIEVYLILFILAFLTKAILKILNKYKKIIINLTLSIFFMLTTLVLYQAIVFTPKITGTYCEQLGGTTTFNKAIFETKEIVGDDEIFSLYSTGLEIALGQYQPTGYDYIIHALGDSAQQKYVDTFLQGEYKYVQTPSMDVAEWVANQNWYFYKHLLSGYEKIFKTEYSWIWKKTDIEKIVADVEYEIVPINDSTIKIVCTSSYTKPFIAEFLVDYNMNFKNSTSYILSLGKNNLSANIDIVIDAEHYIGANYPSTSIEYMPIKMVDGKGEITLYSTREGCILNLNSISYSQNYPVFYLGS